MKKLSVIIPSFNEEELIENTAKVIHEILVNNKIEHELLFVDDGSSDATREKIQKAHDNIKEVVGVSFSRNFGKEAAMMAGLQHCVGDCAVVIDCDLQHPPIKIIEMYNLWLEGYDVVEGIKSDRGKESGLHKLFSKFFYSLMSYEKGFDAQNTSDFKLVDRKVIDVLLTFKEKYTFFRMLSHWVGFKNTKVEYEVEERKVGTSKWSLKKLISYALENISSFSSWPLQISTFFGVIFGIASIVLLIFKQITLFAIFFVGAIILICLGILGYYFSKLYEQSKQRPRYIVEKIIGRE